MNALVFNGLVIQVEITTFPVHSSFEWVPIPNGVTVEVGYTYANGVFSAPPAITLSLAQDIDNIISSGLVVKGSGAPNGTYIVASGIPFGREDIGTEAQFVSTFSEFTNGAQTLEWPLIDGKTFVTFPDTTSFLNFAKAAAQFYAACKAVIATGQGPIPSNQVTIP